MLDYNAIIKYSFDCNMSSREIASALNASKSGVNDFLTAFKNCGELSYPLPPGITNAEIHKAVYGANRGRLPDSVYIAPDYEEIVKDMTGNKNMTRKYAWNSYRRRCQKSGDKFYSYRRFCELLDRWCVNSNLSVHFEHVPGQRMEVDFAGQTFPMYDKANGEHVTITVYVAVLPYSQAIYAEGMTSLREENWIDVNNNALAYFGGVPHLVVPDNCKQAVLQNKDWLAPDLNLSYKEWADWNSTFIMPAKVSRPTYKSSVEGAVGILERGIFLEMASIPFFALDDFNSMLWKGLDELNHRHFSKKPHSRFWYLEQEKNELLPLPATPYEYAVQKTAKVRSDSHVCFSNAYYSVPYANANKTVTLHATKTRVRIFSTSGQLLADWERSDLPGQWNTNPAHMPDWYHQFVNTDGAEFIRQGAGIGPNVCRFIQTLLTSVTVPVQAYRHCHGVLRLARTYSPEALEKCCRDALDADRTTYSYIRDTIPGIAAELMQNQECNVEAQANPVQETLYVATADRSDLEQLLKRSASLVHAENQKGTDK